MWIVVLVVLVDLAEEELAVVGWRGQSTGCSVVAVAAARVRIAAADCCGIEVAAEYVGELPEQQVERRQREELEEEVEGSYHAWPKEGNQRAS